MIVFGRNFRGFRDVEIDLKKINFLVGDNSSGKSSILYLIEAVCERDLEIVPRIDEEFGASRYDYFSPYFDDRDVSFGFIAENDDGISVGKVITVKKTDRLMPAVVRCSYWADGVFATFRRRGRKIESFTEVVQGDPSAKELYKRHRGVKNKFSVSNGNNPGVSLSSVMHLYDSGNDELIKVAKAVMNLDIPESRIVAPVRALPERFYSSRRKYKASGAHFATMWLDLNIQESEIIQTVNDFGKDSKLFDAFSVNKISEDVYDPPLYVTIERNGKKFSLDQVGVGVSQVVPVIIDAIFSSKISASPLLVQQPELHLHPIAQAAFGTFMFKLGQQGFRAVLETHSSFLIDRFRSELRDEFERRSLETKMDRNTESRAQILYCSSGSNGNVVRKIPIFSDGRLGNPPEAYSEFFVDELIRTMF